MLIYITNYKVEFYNIIWQAFEIIYLQEQQIYGDERKYDNACSLRSVTSVDGKRADYFSFTNEFLSKIIKDLDVINRVTYKIISKLLELQSETSPKSLEPKMNKDSKI